MRDFRIPSTSLEIYRCGPGSTVETRKWVLTKLRPDRSGDKVEQTHKGDTTFLAIWQTMSGGKPTDGERWLRSSA